MKLLKLTSSNQTNPGVDVYINADEIVFFNIGDRNDATYIKLKTLDTFLFVKEKPVMIAKMLQEGNS